MNICIITHVNHIKIDSQYFGYGPYIREMNIWLRYVDNVIVVAPLEKPEKTPIDNAYEHGSLLFKHVPDFNIIGVKQLFNTLYSLPKLFQTVYQAMHSADHIHLRCPGNMGLIGCIVQVFFPKKKKTAKYAGNWDLKAKQPWSYRLQKWILNNTTLTKNMQVLVYGAWEGSSANIKPFFTATYSESEKGDVKKRDWSGCIRFMFVGTLVDGKRPLYAVQLVEELFKAGRTVSLQFFGEGNQREILQDYIATHGLDAFIKLEGNQTKETVLEAYKNAHFLILASKSEGWPKVVAEAMFWGAVPIATKISCVPYMLDGGNRGILLEMDLETDVHQINTILENPLLLDEMAQKGVAWSRHYTLEKFESEIKALL